MTIKKIVMIVAGVVAVLALVVALFAGAIAGIVFYTLGNSEAAETARQFLRNNEKLARDIGKVEDFGSIVTGNVDVANSDGQATLNLKVIGARRTTDVSVNLIYKNRYKWRVTGATYKNEAGRTVELLDKYESPDETPATEDSGRHRTGSKGALMYVATRRRDEI